MLHVPPVYDGPASTLRPLKPTRTSVTHGTSNTNARPVGNPSRNANTPTPHAIIKQRPAHGSPCSPSFVSSMAHRQHPLPGQLASPASKANHGYSPDCPCLSTRAGVRRYRCHLHPRRRYWRSPPFPWTISPNPQTDPPLSFPGCSASAARVPCRVNGNRVIWWSS